MAAIDNENSVLVTLDTGQRLRHWSVDKMGAIEPNHRLVGYTITEGTGLVTAMELVRTSDSVTLLLVTVEGFNKWNLRGWTKSSTSQGRSANPHTQAPKPEPTDAQPPVSASSADRSESLCGPQASGTGGPVTSMFASGDME